MYTLDDQNYINKVIEDIDTLYSSKNAQEINLAQHRLQTYQKSSFGYQLGLELLNHNDKQVKYFGALTITVYLNTNQIESGSYFDELSQIILVLFNQDFVGNSVIIKKLLSNLSNLYVASPNFDPIEKLLNFENVQSIHDLTLSQFELLLLFLTIIAEDISRDPQNLNKVHINIHDTMFQRLTRIFEYLLDNMSQISPSVKLLALDCLNSWVIYISIAENHSKLRYSDEMSIFIKFIFQQLDGEFIELNMEYYNKIFTILSEIIDHIPRILNEYKTAILNVLLIDDDKFGATFITLITSSREFMELYSFEIENFVNMILNYLELNMIQVTRNLHDSNVDTIIKQILRLTDIQMMPIEEEKISEQVISFWEEFVNTLIDDKSTLEELDKAKFHQIELKSCQISLEVCQIYYKKLKIHQGQLSQEFARYRNFVSDLFILFYSNLGNNLYSLICDSIMINIQENNIQDVECGLYILYKITSDIYFYEYEDEDENGTSKFLIPLINKVFSADLIAKVEQSNNQQANISLLNFISVIQFFFISPQGEPYLSVIFNFLFNLILRDVSSKLSLIASKTVYKISLISKINLTSFLPNLESILIEMTKTPAVDSLIRERLTNSYFSILKTVKHPSDLGDKIDLVLNQIDELYLINIENDEYLTSLISCVYEISKATVYEEGELTITEIELMNNYWQQDPLGIKIKTLQLINKYSIDNTKLSQSTIVTEKCCQILKSNLNEAINGPFKIDLDIIYQFIIIKIKNCNVASISHLHKLIESTILTNHSKIQNQSMELIFREVILNIVPLFQSDPDLVKTSVMVFNVVLETSPSLIIYSNLFTFEVIPLCLKCFRFNETYVLKQVIRFWNNVVTLKKGKYEDQQLIKNLMQDSIGNQLVNTLLSAFTNCPRSNLDYYYPLFRNLIGKFPMEFKNDLTQIMMISQLGKVKLSQEDAKQFINKLMVTRGSRMCNDILKQYWLTTNKLIDYT